MTFIIFLLITMLMFGVFYLDARGKIDLVHKGVMCLFLMVIPHISLLIYIFNQYAEKQKNFGIWQALFIAEGILFITYIGLKVNIQPYSKKQIVGYRMRVLSGGRRLVLYGLYTLFVQVVIFYFAWNPLMNYKVPASILVLDMIVTILSVVTLHVNGMLRILLTSRRINMIKKVYIASTMLIPIIHVFVIMYVCSVAKSEYEHECYRVVNQNMRIDSAVCKTKYPLVLVHGVGFKDLKYINYWGRIPKELIRNGATIYYGNQEAWGTVEYNAQDMKDRILETIRQTGCEKVNIIAHSKGGLDARYMISELNMGDYVASLTLMGVPHQGSKIIDIIYHIPKGMFQTIGKGFNKYFRLIGEKNPDFFTATRQLSTYYCKEFNEKVKDCDQVYYQSYATVMRHLFSDYILIIPYLLLRIMDGENDGLVTVESSKWGEFKGVLKNKHSRGISHGDIIDLRKNDYRGFDVREHYVKMVAELKDLGY